MIPGYEGLYMVSNLGRVKSLNYNHTGKERLLILRTADNGYLKVDLHKNGIQKRFSVHRLVAMAFIPNPDNLPCVNHKDEDKTNNCVENLEWCTRKYNANYGTAKQRWGEKLSKKVAQYAPDFPCELIKVWNSETEAARELRKQGVKINKCNISDVLNGRQKTAGGFGWGYWE